MAHKVAELANTMSETHSVLHQVAGFMSKTWLQPVKISPKEKRPWPYPLLTADLKKKQKTKKRNLIYHAAAVFRLPTLDPHGRTVP